MKVTLKADGLEAVVAQAAGFSARRINAAMATALTRVAVAAREDQKREMRDSFDRPTPYTVGRPGDPRTGAVYAKPATADRLESEVGIKDDPVGGRAPIKWLGVQVRGGQRRWTGFERALIRGGAMPDDMRAVPGRFARLDAYGNISRGLIIQILSQLRIGTGLLGSERNLPRLQFEDSAAERKRKQGKIRSAYRRAGGQFLALPRGRGKLMPGIYQVRDTAWGRTAPRPVIVFVNRAMYEPRFDFYFVARLAASRMGRELERAIAKSIERRGGS